MTASEIENDHFDLDHFDRDKKSTALIQGTGLRCLSNTDITDETDKKTNTNDTNNTNIFDGCNCV